MEEIKKEEVEREKEALYHRQLDVFFGPEFPHHVSVFGAGAIGSYFVDTIAKMGIEKITVYDFDKVEKHNIPNQIYSLEDCGKDKVEALKERIKATAGLEITPVSEKVDDSFPPIVSSGIFVFAVDTMKARKEIFERYVLKNNKIKLVMEFRMGAEHAVLYTFDPSNPYYVSQWMKEMKTDEEIQGSACTARAINSTIKSICGLAAHHLVTWHKKEEVPNETLLIMRPLTLITNTWKIPLV